MPWSQASQIKGLWRTTPAAAPVTKASRTARQRRRAYSSAVTTASGQGDAAPAENRGAPQKVGASDRQRNQRNSAQANRERLEEVGTTTSSPEQNTRQRGAIRSCAIICSVTQRATRDVHPLAAPTIARENQVVTSAT